MFAACTCIFARLVLFRSLRLPLHPTGSYIIPAHYNVVPNAPEHGIVETRSINITIRARVLGRSIYLSIGTFLLRRNTLHIPTLGDTLVAPSHVLHVCATTIRATPRLEYICDTVEDRGTGFRSSRC